MASSSIQLVDEVFTRNYAKLCDILSPIISDILPALHSEKVITFDSKRNISEKPTARQKAVELLDSVIKPSFSVGLFDGFYNLLMVMKGTNSNSCIYLADSIISDLPTSAVVAKCDWRSTEVTAAKRVKCGNGEPSILNWRENFNILVIGIAGHGKSALSNFILQEDAFQTRSGFIPVSEKSEKRTKVVHDVHLNIIDTVGFSDSVGLQEHHLDQISNALKVFPGGINAVIFTIKCTERFTINISTILTGLLEMSDIWDHCFVVFTHVKSLASAEPEQLDIMLKDPNCPESLISLMKMVKYTYMLVESVLPMEENYYLKKIDEMLGIMKCLTSTSYTNKMFELAYAEYKKSKEEVKVSEALLQENQQLLEIEREQLAEERQKLKRDMQEREEREKEEREQWEREEREKEEREKWKREEREKQEREKQEREKQEREKREREQIQKYKQLLKHKRRPRWLSGELQL